MIDQKTKLIFCSGVSTVTGANFLLKINNGKNILIDCGLIQGESFADEANRKDFIYKPDSIDCLLVTHAHLDHVGRIPKLIREGFSGMIYSTPETKILAELVLNDALGILTKEAEINGLETLYSEDDIKKAFSLWETVEYHKSLEIFDGVSIFMKDAGHILGSAMIEVSIKNDRKDTKILFTGDLGNSPSPLLRDTEPIGDIDYLIIESTYGDRNHESREESTLKLEKIIKDTVDRGGTLVIPTFSVDRTQVLLYEINNLVEKGKIPSIPVFLDSPMAIKATEIYRSSLHLFNDSVKKQIDNGDDIFSFPRLKFTVAQWESKEIEKTSGSKIILAGSGMSHGGRVVGHEKQYLPDPKNTILLVGYQSLGSLGRGLADGVKKVHINNENIHVNAHIDVLHGYSAHKDSDNMVNLVGGANDRLKRVFVAMGEPKSSMYLAQRINNEVDTEAIVPEITKEYLLG
ncbi:MAG: MBL fold metallo-hydrolase [Candidatus Paceibacterota bacterium]|jgi:metallo-beta-lactamase family protein